MSTNLYGDTIRVTPSVILKWRPYAEDSQEPAPAQKKENTDPFKDDLDSLPVGTVVLAHWADGSQPDMQIMRCHGGYSSQAGFAVSGGRHWTDMSEWGAVITVLHWA